MPTPLAATLLLPLAGQIQGASKTRPPTAAASDPPLADASASLSGPRTPGARTSTSLAFASAVGRAWGALGQRREPEELALRCSWLTAESSIRHHGRQVQAGQRVRGVGGGGVPSSSPVGAHLCSISSLLARQ